MTTKAIIITEVGTLCQQHREVANCSGGRWNAKRCTAFYGQSKHREWTQAEGVASTKEFKVEIARIEQGHPIVRVDWCRVVAVIEDAMRFTVSHVAVRVLRELTDKAQVEALSL